jgi:hypothetical protein
MVYLSSNLTAAQVARFSFPNVPPMTAVANSTTFTSTNSATLTSAVTSLPSSIHTMVNFEKSLSRSSSTESSTLSEEEDLSFSSQKETETYSTPEDYVKIRSDRYVQFNMDASALPRDIPWYFSWFADGNGLPKRDYLVIVPHRDYEKLSMSFSGISGFMEIDRGRFPHMSVDLKFKYISEERRYASTKLSYDYKMSVYR